MGVGKMILLFYRASEQPYGCFSNFSRHNVKLYGIDFPTAEHAFQAMKFLPHRPDLVEAVYRAENPKEAAAIGRDRQNPIRADWDDPIQKPHPVFMGDGRGPGPLPVLERIKDQVMCEVIRAKFTQHSKLREILLNTGTTPIVEDSPYDYYWGWGQTRVGVNRLGKILMLVRWEFTRAESPSAHDDGPCEKFLRRVANGGKIISSAQQTPTQIAVALAEDRMLVTQDGLGFVYVPD